MEMLLQSEFLLCVTLFTVFTDCGIAKRGSIDDICIPESGVSVDTLIDSEKNPPIGHELKNYFKCVYQKQGYLGQDGAILMDNLKNSYYLHKNHIAKVQCLEKLKKEDILEDVDIFKKCINIG